MAANRSHLLLYQAISSLAGLLGWPYFYWHLRSRGRGESFLPRLGLKLPPEPPSGSPRLLIHGVSVGEALAAAPLVQELKALLPGASITVTTGTETGQAVARQQFLSLGANVAYFPLDLPWAVRRCLDRLRPQIFVGLESEIWPNFLHEAHRRGVCLALVNARLSDETFRRYLKYRRYLIDILNYYALIAAGSNQDFERYEQLCLRGPRLHLTGNLKCDRLLAAWNLEMSAPGAKEGGDAGAVARCERYGRLLDLQGEPVFLAASTHPGEEEVLLEAYGRLRGPYPALLLILAPRHPERAPGVVSLLQAQGLNCHLWSRLKSGQETRHQGAVVVDTVGDLFSLYGLADVAFVGGSLVPHGGQNILEPAAWGRAPLYGPHLENFRWAQAILEEAGAGLMVRDDSSLAAAALDLLEHPERRSALGARARDALVRHRGAARRTAQLLVELWERGTDGGRGPG